MWMYVHLYWIVHFVSYMLLILYRGYRIVQFHKSDTLDLSHCASIRIPTKTDPDLRPSDYFLREHFKLAVQSSILNGGKVDGFDPQWFQ